MANVHADPREQDHTRSVRPRTEAVPVGPPGSYVILAANHPTPDPRNTMQRELATSLAAQANLCEHDFSLWPPCASTYANRVTRRMVFDMISDLFSQAAPGRIRFLSFIGHGAPLSGDWEVVDGAISLQDILFEWRRHNPLSEPTKECGKEDFVPLVSFSSDGDRYHPLPLARLVLQRMLGRRLQTGVSGASRCLHSKLGTSQ